MINGWIRLDRHIQRHWIWSDPDNLRAWISILMNVNYEPSKVLIRGKLLNCGVGESVRSLDSWGTLFGSWSKKRVSRFFKLLEKDEMIVTESVTVTTRLRVCNYSEYQNVGHVDAPTEETPAHPHPTRRGSTKEQINNPDNKTKKHKPKSFLISNNIDWIEQEIWEEWIDFKIKRKTAISERALNSNIKKLESIGKASAGAVLAQSMDCGWTDIFPLKKGNTGHPAASGGVKQTGAGAHSWARILQKIQRKPIELTEKEKTALKTIGSIYDLQHANAKDLGYMRNQYIKFYEALP